MYVLECVRVRSVDGAYVPTFSARALYVLPPPLAVAVSLEDGLKWYLLRTYVRTYVLNCEQTHRQTGGVVVVVVVVMVVVVV